MNNIITGIRYSVLSLFILGGGILAPTTVFAEGCIPITSVPVTISEPGTYCLTGDLVHMPLHGFAINIQADNVTLDFKGYELKGQSNNNMQGVLAGGAVNIIIRNGKITNMRLGVHIGRNSIVENMVITNIANQGIMVNPSDDSIVRNNVISNIVPLIDTAVTGILALSCTQGGKAVRVTGNVVSGFKNFPGGTRSAIGIESKACYGIIEENSINGELTSHYGIHITYAGRHLIRGNSFTGGMSKAVVCGYFSGFVKYKDNISTSEYGGKYECLASGDLGGNI